MLLFLLSYLKANALYLTSETTGSAVPCILSPSQARWVASQISLSSYQCRLDILIINIGIP